MTPTRVASLTKRLLQRAQGGLMLARQEILAWQWGEEEDCAAFLAEVDTNNVTPLSRVGLMRGAGWRDQ